MFDPTDQLEDDIPQNSSVRAELKFIFRPYSVLRVAQLLV